MRRVLSPVVAYLVAVGRSMAGTWDAFWFTPADPTLLGVLRILTGAMLLYTHAVWGLALEDFFGPASWLSPGLVREIQSNQLAGSFWWWVPAGWMWPAYGIAMMILGLFTIGLCTRVTSVLALAVAISFVHRVPSSLFGLDQINILLTLYLAIGPSGQVLSVDRRLARRAGAGPARPTPRVGANL